MRLDASEAQATMTEPAGAITLDSGGSPAAARMRPLERLAALCDPGTLRRVEITDSRGEVGVVAAVGRIGPHPVVCYAQDSRLAGGSVGTAEADLVVRVLRLARAERMPVVGFLESAGARLQDGAAALGGFGRIFFENVRLNGTAPQISVITGTAAGGGCYSPALTDFTVMTRPATMFLTGPKVVHEAVGEEISASALGGPRVHERTGVCHFVARDDHDAVAVARELVDFLAPRAEAPAARLPQHARRTPPGGPFADPGRHVPRAAREVYDMRDVVRDVVDDGRLLEVAARWARNLIVGFARIGGVRVGIVANQPRHLGGVLDAKASEKGAAFVTTCQTYGVPLVVLVDTPGFMPGSGQESAGVIRHGAQLVRAFAAATVPRVTVLVRKAYGGAYITMNSKELGADLVLAWPGSEVGVMGSRAAVHILHRRELAVADEPEVRAQELADGYAASNIVVDRALELGLVDAIIPPRATRRRLASALQRLV